METDPKLSGATEASSSKTESQGEAEVRLTSADLARSYVAFQGVDTLRQIKAREASLRFNQTYEPRRASRPSYIEPGSMDANDWDVAELDDEQWEDEKEVSIARDEDAIEDLKDKLAETEELLGKIDAGDASAIEYYSKLETRRRAELEEAKRKLESKKS